MCTNVIPRHLKEIKLLDGRPAYIFVHYDGKFPTQQTINGKLCCPYCGKEMENQACNCYSYKRIAEFNESLK